MSSTIQTLVRNLQAAAVAPSEDGKNVYLLEEAEGNLLQELWVDDQPDMKTFVTGGVKENTPALYLVDETERYIFFLDDTNQLRCVAYDNDAEEWDDAPFNDILGEIEVHEGTQLSGFSNPSGMMVVFETHSGQLATLVGHGGQWKVTGEIPTKLKPGAAHTTFDGLDGLHVFCFGHEGQILHLIQDHNSGNWDVSIIENSELEAAPSRILAFPKENEPSFDLYVLSNSQLLRIEAGGVRTNLGVVEGTKLIPQTAAECFFVIPCALACSYLLGYHCGRWGSKFAHNSMTINYSTESCAPAWGKF